jgi:hypothetical protein
MASTCDRLRTGGFIYVDSPIAQVFAPLIDLDPRLMRTALRYQLVVSRRPLGTKTEDTESMSYTSLPAALYYLKLAADDPTAIHVELKSQPA